MEGRLYIQHEKLGTVEICGDENAITSISFVECVGKEIETPVTFECKKQLLEYFLGYRKKFNFEKLKFKLKGTEFQKMVWGSLLKIPYGETISYSEQAKLLGRPNSYRAVATANSKNPIGIIFPCHRVIGGDGNLKGYSGGLRKKDYLIKFEKNIQDKRNDKLEYLKCY